MDGAKACRAVHLPLGKWDPGSAGVDCGSSATSGGVEGHTLAMFPEAQPKEYKSSGKLLGREVGVSLLLPSLDSSVGQCHSFMGDYDLSTLTS